MKDKIINILKDHLAKERPVFHSEADFQFALAWAIKEKHQEYKVRLEFPFDTGKERKYLDICVEDSDKKLWAIELKYHTAKLDLPNLGEGFYLKPQNGQNHRRYNFVKDIKRLEEWKCPYKKQEGGFALLLTNDSNLFKSPREKLSKAKGTKGADFCIHEGAELRETLRWTTGTKIRKSMEDPIELRGKYRMDWECYRKIDSDKNNIFKYLLVEVK